MGNVGVVTRWKLIILKVVCSSVADVRRLKSGMGRVAGWVMLVWSQGENRPKLRHSMHPYMGK